MYINKKRELLTLFFQLTCEVEDMLEREEYEQLDNKLNERQTLIQAINELDRLAGADSMRQAAIQLEKVLVMAARKETEVKAKMLQRKNEVSQKLQKINASKKLNHSYATKAYSMDGYFIDRTVRPR